MDGAEIFQDDKSRTVVDVALATNDEEPWAMWRWGSWTFQKGGVNSQKMAKTHEKHKNLGDLIMKTMKKWNLNHENHHER